MHLKTNPLIARSCSMALALVFTTVTQGFPQSPQPASHSDQPASKSAGPIQDVTFELVLLMESDDQNRTPYDGPAAKGLDKAGYGRMVIAGSATAMVTIGQPATVTGSSRYGQLSVTANLLNTTRQNEVQVRIHLQTRNESPVTIETTARVPMEKWFLVGSADSRLGLPKATADGKRSVAVMRINHGVLVLE